MKPLMTSKYAVGMVLLLCGLLASCSSSPKALAPLADDFSTERFSNGLQVFVYTVSFPSASLSPLESRKTARQTRSPASVAALVRVDERLDLRLKREGYCADGFIELERFVGADHARIRGECR